MVIIGSGGFGTEVSWLVERINLKNPTWELLGFIDENKQHGSFCGGYPVLGGLEWIEQNKDTYVVCAIGSSQIRKTVLDRIEGAQFATLIDPSVLMSPRVKIGSGSIICAGNIFTVDINIGSHVIVNLDCTIGHNSVLKDFVTLYPSVNVSGDVILNESVEIGTGSQILQNIEIAARTTVGAGAVVRKNIIENGTYVGVPARKIR